MQHRMPISILCPCRRTCRTQHPPPARHMRPALQANAGFSIFREHAGGHNVIMCGEAWSTLGVAKHPPLIFPKYLMGKLDTQFELSHFDQLKPVEL